MKSVLIPFVMVMLAAGGCGRGASAPSGPVSEADIAKITVGMTEAEVRAILGEPESTSSVSKDGRTVTAWFYDRDETSAIPFVSVQFEHGRVLLVR